MADGQVVVVRPTQAARTVAVEDEEVCTQRCTADQHADTAAEQESLAAQQIHKDNTDQRGKDLDKTNRQQGHQGSMRNFSLLKNLGGVENGRIDAAELLEEHEHES